MFRATDCQKRDASQAVRLHLNTTGTQHSGNKVQTELPFGAASNYPYSTCHSTPTPTTAQARMRLSPRSESQPLDSRLSPRPQKRPGAQRLRHKKHTRRAPYRTGSSGAGLQIHHHGWLRADNGILDQILYGGQICSPFILLSANQEEMQKSHNEADTFSPYTAPTASRASKTLHGLSLVITSQVLCPCPVLTLPSA